MIPITYNSQALYLLDDLPDWGTPIKATASLLTAQESGLTDREARRAHGETLRLRLRYQIKASGTAARRLAASLRAHQNEPVCAPLWPAACAWSDRASAEITGGLKLLQNSNWATWGARTNLISYSNNFSAAGWAGYFGVPASLAKNVTDPFGVANNAWSFLISDAYYGPNPPGFCGIINSIAALPDYTPVTISCWMKADAAVSANFAVSDYSGGGVNITTTWQRHTFTGQYIIIGGRGLQMVFFGGQGQPAGTKVYLYGAQVEVGSSASSYIETSGAVITTTELAIYESTAPGWASATDTLVPLVVGYLGSRDNRWITDTFATFDVELIENCAPAWAITPAAYTAPAGPLPIGYATAPRLFPFLTHWDGPRTGYTLRIARDDIGFGRQTSDVARAAAVARTVEQTAWASTADGWSAAKLLAFFSTHGAGASFWASGQQSAAVLAADLAASATTATVTDTTGLVISDRLGLVQKGQLTGWVGPLTGIASPTLSFVSSGNAASPAATTSLVPLLLARFDSPKLELEWITDRLATASFRVRELPPELALPAGETLGTTLGALAPRAWLYEFTKTFPGATVVSRYTSYERDLTYGGNTYTAKKLTHGDIKTGLALDRDELSIDCDGLEITPLLDIALLRCEVPLMVAVLRADITCVGTAGNATTAWSGEVAAASIKAKRIAAKAVALGGAFDRKAPRFYLQPGCNHGLFSTGCGLSAATFAHTATLTAVGTAGYPYTFTIGSIARAGGAVLTAADVFAGGWIEIGTGASLTRRAILASSAVSASACVLTLSGDPSPFPTNGTACVIYPGCDGRKETCATTFGNYLNFGGAPFVPTGNPSLFKLSSDAGAGGKK